MTVMLETPKAIANAAAIAAVPGIDMLLMGCSDLTLEMGIPGKFEDPRLVAAIESTIAACRQHGKIPALGATLTVGGVQIDVVAASDRAVEAVRLTKKKR